MADRCVCGSGVVESACCGPILDGAPAETALALMRSRYAAYVRGDVDHIVATHDPDTRATVDPKAVARRSRDTSWQGLEILATEAGGPDDDTGIVEFVARGITRDIPFNQRERSRFRRLDGRWYYIDGKLVNDPIRRPPPAAGRNDPCPCGSGMKYKRCHGA